MSSIRIRARQTRSTVSDIWRACSARSVNEHASRCLLLGKFSKQMPERFRRSRTRYENNERIYVGEKKERREGRERKKKEGRGGEKSERELFKRIVEYLLRSSSPHSFRSFTIAGTIPNSNTSGFILSNWINSDLHWAWLNERKFNKSLECAKLQNMQIFPSFCNLDSRIAVNN